MGVKVDAFKKPETLYVEAVSSLNGYIQERIKRPWLWPKFIYRWTLSGKQYYKNLKILHDFAVSVINDHIKSRRELGESKEINKFVKKKFFLDMLLDLYEKGEIDTNGIQEEVDTFIFAGMDTSSAGLAWILYHLGKHPDVQETLYEELRGNSKKDNFHEVKYLEYVIKEGLRLHPPAVSFSRKLDKDTTIDGTFFKKGTGIALNVLSLHTNPEYWKNPLDFNPGRFAEEQFIKRHPYCYIPFSAGPRNCVGQKFAMCEMKTMLFQIVSTFTIESIQEESDIQSCFEVIHRSKNGLHIKLYKR
jgi:cytochrome P450